MTETIDLPKDPLVAYLLGKEEGANYEREAAVTAIYERYSENHPDVANSIVGMLLNGRHHE